MAAVESGQSFTVTRDGPEIGELIPLRRRRRFVARGEFFARSRNAASVDNDAFRLDQAAAADQEVADPCDRWCPRSGPRPLIAVSRDERGYCP
jgi:antitoxin (DNA-binding transcriptional repressor) of toxin-antitoxin stability system